MAIHLGAVGLLLVAGLLPAAAVRAAEGLDIRTPYPAVAVAPGSDVTFDISVETAVAGPVDLALEGVPEGWTAELRGGGFVVDGVQTVAGEPTQVTLDVSVPADASGTETMTVRATDGQLTTELPLSFRIEPEAAGEVTLTTEFPELRGPADATFQFNMTLANETPEDLTFAISGEAQVPGWTVTVQVTGQEQAASATVEAGGTVSLQVQVTPPQNVEAGVVPIVVTATGGGQTVTSEVSVDITGRYGMTLSTPDDRLNLSGSAGGEIRQTIVITNTGTAPLENVELTASDTPTGWTVAFEPATAGPIAPNETGQVTAIIEPSGNAIAGDYAVTISASNDNATAEQAFRVTVETSILWGLIGVALIVAVLAGLWFVFQRFGRR